MNADLSPNAQAILLLTAPLLAGRRRRPPRPRTQRGSVGAAKLRPLSTAEYRDFAKRLRAIRREPADLLGSDARETVRESLASLDAERIHRLLGRGFLLAQAVERWRTRALWVVTRADPDYPRKLKTRMRGNAPPVLYGCGDRTILDGGGLAVVGSRKVKEDLIEYTEDVGKLSAEANTTIISGCARGVDQAAMRGALEAGGRSVGVLANGLERAALNRGNRSALMEGQLVLVCPYDPAARFVVGHAMQRNKLIYALSDAALVVNSDHGHGGTWAGATDQLDKLRFVSVYVRASGRRSKGLEGLLDRGATSWPNPRTPDELERVLRGEPLEDQSPASAPTKSGQYDLSLAESSEVREDRPDQSTKAQGEDATSDGPEDGTLTAAVEHRPELAETASLATPREKLLLSISGDMSRQDILTALGLRNLGNLRKRYLKPCLEQGWIEMTIPEKPSSVNQRFRLTQVGRDHLKELGLTPTGN
ncbi:MAG: DNA-processing protein DprA [Gammaproteobacteria bacterium]|nr:DNA-processing protein DprA [Gammaproteobacteria bacterium]MDE0259441.1 DNA-processing protein DprA [Gammaproteobacteria bacterium]